MNPWVLRVLLPDPPLKRDLTVDHWRAYYDRKEGITSTNEEFSPAELAELLKMDSRWGIVPGVGLREFVL